MNRMKQKKSGNNIQKERVFHQDVYFYIFLGIFQKKWIYERGS